MEERAAKAELRAKKAAQREEKTQKPNKRKVKLQEGEVTVSRKTVYQQSVL